MPQRAGITGKRLEELYGLYNRRKYVHPDPLEFLYNYPGSGDREIAGLIASSLAYGRVAQILKSVGKILDKMGPSPRSFVLESSRRDFAREFRGFKHRFTTDDEIVFLLSGIKNILKKYGSLNECFVHGIDRSAETVVTALGKFSREINPCCNYLVPSHEKGSACKRLNLYLRWMVRKDAVDPGGWKGVPPSMLIIPLDTHMARIGQELGLTSMKSAGMRMALDITSSFRKFEHDDPVKYDFVLTRFGIRKDFHGKSMTVSGTEE